MSFRKLASVVWPDHCESETTTPNESDEFILENIQIKINKREDPKAKSSEGFLFTCTITVAVTPLSMTRYNLTKSYVIDKFRNR